MLIKTSRDQVLRAVAVAAPEYSEGVLGRRTLSSNDPASLYNACRRAAFLAENGIGPWGESNWAGSRRRRRDAVLLMHTLREDIGAFQELLLREQPNLLLLGAMTLCFPGAIECAKLAKAIFGNRICTILGGRHVTETMYLNAAGHVVHHSGSPLKLMAELQIDQLFDVVVAGEGEYLIPKIGEIISRFDDNRCPSLRITEHLGELCRSPGRWILGCLVGNEIVTAKGRGGPLDRDTLPVPCAMFGIQTAFDIFGGRLTAHVFSDTGPGCAYDCSFCSERRSVTGPLQQANSSANRLFRQLEAVVQVVQADNPLCKASAFVEDSTLLAGSNTALAQLINLLSKSNLDLRFGAQLTIDQILGRAELLRDLKLCGLDYLFVGLETLTPESIGGMSKNVGRRRGDWIDRMEEVLGILSDLRITCGAALLFGLGETRQNRLTLFEYLGKWRKRWGFPEPISLNWAVQHPLMGNDGSTAYTYHRWGTPAGPYLEAFQSFGEASLYYPISGQKSPTLEEVEEVLRAYNDLHVGRSMSRVSE